MDEINLPEYIEVPATREDLINITESDPDKESCSGEIEIKNPPVARRDH